MLKNKRCYDKSFMNQEFPTAIEDNSKTMMSQDMYGQGMCCPIAPEPMMCPPIMECPQERCCHRYICHEVPQE